MKQKRINKANGLDEGEGKRKTGPIMGLDIHKSVIAVCIVTEAQILLERTVENTFDGISLLIGLCTQYHVRSLALKSTSQYHIKVIEKLVEQQVPVLLANPQQTKITQDKKTDRLDAR